MKKTMIVATMFCAAAFASASANTIGWWRFNGEGTNVPNVANPGTLDGTIVSVSNDYTNAIAPAEDVSFGNDSSKCPAVTENLQSDAPRVYDPLDGQVYGGGRTLSYKKPFIQGGVMIPYDSALNLNTFTIQAIIRLPKNASSRNTGYGSGMFPIAQFGKDQTEGWMFSVYNGYLYSRFTYKKTDGTTGQQGSTDYGHEYYYTGSGFPSLYDGKWHHVAMVFTTAGVNAVCRMFVDGVQCAENRATNWKEWNYSGNLPLFIGAHPYNYARTFYGDIAEVRITNDSTSKDQNNNFLVPLLDGQGFADDDTALLLTFDSAAKFGFPTNMTLATKETSGTSDTHGNKAYMWYAKNWNILNAAYNAPAVPFWPALATKGTNEYLNVDLWPKMNVTAARSGDLLECSTCGITNAIVNSAVLDIPTESVSGNGGSNAIKLDNAASYISTNSFTAECIFKTSIADGDTDTIFFTPFMKLCVYQGKLLLRGYASSANRNSIGDITSSSKVNDGEWHHAACVYEATGSKSFALYLDGSPVGSKTGKTLCSGPHSDGNGFVIGAQYVSITAAGAQAFRGLLDSVRITRRVLTSDEFLKSSTPERLFDARFDNDIPPDFSSGVPAYIMGNGVGYAMENGAAPSTVASRSGSVVFDGVCGSEKSGFGEALRLEGGYVLYPRNRLLERQDFTVEFFAKLSDLRTNSRIIALNWGNGVGNPVWTLYKSSGSGGVERLTLSCYTTIDGGVTDDGQQFQHLYRLAADDNKWHHWAMTVSPTDDGRLDVSLYKDHVLVQNDMPWKFNGNTYHCQMYIPPQGTCLSIAGSVYTGMTIDNVRITPGVLDPSEFMGYESAGLMILLK